MSDYNKKRMEHILKGRPLPEKKTYKLKQVSDKTAAKKKAEAKTKEQLGEEETQKQRWFNRRRHEMTGTCQCGCGNRSSKYQDEHFRNSACHIFPQRLFPSVQFHHLNWVERAFWTQGKGSSCHTNMDNRSVDKWPLFADWEDIKAKFHELSPLLADEERKKKFYKNLEWLVYNK